MVAIAECAWRIGVGPRIASRPPVRAEIPNVKILARANGADRKAFFVRTDICMTFAFQKYDVSRACFFGAGHQLQQALAWERFRMLNAGGFQNRGSDVDQVD